MLVFVNVILVVRPISFARTLLIALKGHFTSCSLLLNFTGPAVGLATDSSCLGKRDSMSARQELFVLM